MRDKHVQRPWIRVVAVAVGLALLAAACGSSGKSGNSGGDASGKTTTTKAPEATPVKGGELVFGAESDVSTLDVGAAAQPSDKVITLGLYDPLMSYKDGKIVPYLAESLDAAGEDLATWTMKLRSGVTFHDGTPLNADSIVKHFKRLQDPATGCSCLDLAKIVASMDTPDGPDGLTVVFHLATPSVAFPDTLAGSTGYVESPTATAKYGAEYKNHPVGTGPFTLAEYVPNDRVVLQAYPGYWQKDDNGIQLPYLDKLTIKPIPDSGQRVAALEAGNIDIFQTADSGTIADAEAKGFTAQKISGSSSTILLMNNAKPPFNDVRARQAVAYAINKDAINERVYKGIRKPSYSGFDTASASAMVPESAVWKMSMLPASRAATRWPLSGMGLIVSLSR